MSKNKTEVITEEIWKRKLASKKGVGFNKILENKVTESLLQAYKGNRLI